MGSSAIGSMVTLFSPARVTRTLAPGLSPIFSRRSAGMTTWPLADVVTMGIAVHPFLITFNVSLLSITMPILGVKRHGGCAPGASGQALPGAAGRCRN